MEEAGFAAGFDVSLGHGTGLPPVIAAIREDLARINVRVHPHPGAFSDLVRLARTGEVPLFYYAWACSTGDASDFLNSSLHSRDEVLGLGAENFTGYSDPDVDAVLAAAESELVPARRLELLQRAQRRVLEALPVLPLTVRWSYVGVSDRVDIVARHDRRLWVTGWRWRS
jgi:peptide/nickel transport system substrate-binding protein